ncbi:hypothetical protein MGYG_06916 [Nannizzia gypsea CBS 118893]|uniref:Uncharacterized protein n=1 Tax=Arthroderma gypseum (strain ATCC MYA-4604 / CBS 118893) TaxID=535722 RepID=E4V1K2_ARTGP|nr:hypothetical protein MGYG_06916 [Nannizzia gypsea CBS 118893]EFR03917.1 hypothetical protein MGYG_06916 [Nannizzia gypsea CBS 118893]
MRNLFSIVFLSWLLALASYVQVAAAGNDAAHAFERIWLYEMYEVFCDVDPKQTKIFSAQGTGTVPNSNKGTGPGGRLTYAEFQWRLQGGKTPLVNLQSPKTIGVYQAADELLKLGWTGILKVADIDLTLKGYKAPQNDPNKKNYMELIDRVEKEYSNYRLSSPGKTYESIFTDTARATRIADISHAIYTLREEDRHTFISDKYIWNRNGLWLAVGPNDQQKLKSKISYVDSSGKTIYLGDDYTVTDIAKVFATNCPGGKLGPALTYWKWTSAKDITDWLAKLGDASPAVAGQPTSSPEDITHRRVLESWKTVDQKSAMNLADLNCK